MCNAFMQSVLHCCATIQAFGSAAYENLLKERGRFLHDFDAIQARIACASLAGELGRRRYARAGLRTGGAMR
jgi:hypothetical protein